MLNKSISARSRASGLVLIFSLVVLVVMTLAALALTKSMSTANIIAGNLAFQQAAQTSADAGVETAIKWLEDNNGKTITTATATSCPAGTSIPQTTVLACDQNSTVSGSSAYGYIAHTQDPSSGQSWIDFWNNSLNQYALTLPADTSGNIVSYVTQRLCSASGDTSSSSIACTNGPTPLGGTCASGSDCSAGKINLNPVAPQIYYRITVRVTGPRNTQSLTQTVVAI
jgi:type IV pilus assembly protein PilX